MSRQDYAKLHIHRRYVNAYALKIEPVQPEGEQDQDDECVFFFDEELDCHHREGETATGLDRQS